MTKDNRESPLKKLLELIVTEFEKKYKIERKVLEQVEAFFLNHGEKYDNEGLFRELLLLTENDLRSSYILERYFDELWESWVDMYDYDPSISILDNLYMYIDDAGLRYKFVGDSHER